MKLEIKLWRNLAIAKEHLNRFQYFLYSMRTRPVYAYAHHSLMKAAKDARGAGIPVRVQDESESLTVTMTGKATFIEWQEKQLKQFLDADARDLQEKHDKDGRLLALIRKLGGSPGRAAKGRAADFLFNCAVYIDHEVREQ